MERFNIRTLKRACGIHFSTKAFIREPGVHLRQKTQRFRSFRSLLDDLADDCRFSAVQAGANDRGNMLGDLIRDRPERIERALLIEPQHSAFDRLARRHKNFRDGVCLNTAIDRQPGERKLYSVNRNADARLGEGIASFERGHVEKEIGARMNARCDSEVAALITTENATAAAGIARPNVLMVDTEGFDAEVVRMALAAG